MPIKRYNNITGEWEEISQYQFRLIKLIAQGVIDTGHYQTVRNGNDQLLMETFCDPLNLCILEGPESTIRYMFDLWDEDCKPVVNFLVKIYKSWPSDLGAENIEAWRDFILDSYDLQEVYERFQLISDTGSKLKKLLKQKIKYATRLSRQLEKIKSNRKKWRQSRRELTGGR
jgi:hypothetical protein